MVSGYKASNGRRTITVYGNSYGDALRAAILYLGISFVVIRKL